MMEAEYDPKTPDEVFSPREIRRIKSRVSPLIDESSGGDWLLTQILWGYLFIFAAGIILGQIDRLIDYTPSPFPSLTWWLPIIYAPLRLYWLKMSASFFFTNLDDEYFKRAGITKDEYERVLLRWTYEDAQLIFTEPQYAPFSREKHEGLVDEYIQNVLKYETKLKYKAYVGRWYGLNPPLKERHKV